LVDESSHPVNNLLIVGHKAVPIENQFQILDADWTFAAVAHEEDLRVCRDSTIIEVYDVFMILI
jgi:hypothetical protein